ncbi:heavy metal-associated isoprenylated plant protein 7-like isoform X2 [Magnolia sinica]|uniref:heavy metal-associated isoprenylated plant protein 7-like isoform X2 n=1 Tax=Magnolia sinica TaxID=86752 RepID=UPI0026595923|nr:heavy metal-associated isoprenylated plant protein 7-like isoform X2 [Magnolia sinica]
MGESEEEKKKGGEENKEEEKKEEKKEEVPEEIVLKVDMHCEGCAKKVEKSLRGFEGVEDVKTDCKARKVVVKGKTADPVKVSERVQKKSGRKVEIISPLPKPPEEEKKEDDKDKTEEKKEEPAVITVILKIRMHCEACAQVLQKRIRKMDGVQSVVTDMNNDQVIVKGVVDPTKLLENVHRRTRKQAAIVEEEKKGEEQEKKEDKGEGENKDGEESKGEDDKKNNAKKSEYWPPKYYTEYAYPPQIFSDENPHACYVM